MAISRDHWECPEFYRREDWEGSEQLASRVPYDHEAHRVFPQWKDRFLGLAYRTCAIGIYAGLAYFLLWLVTGRTP